MLLARESNRNKNHSHRIPKSLEVHMWMSETARQPKSAQQKTTNKIVKKTELNRTETQPKCFFGQIKWETWVQVKRPSKFQSQILRLRIFDFMLCSLFLCTCIRAGYSACIHTYTHDTCPNKKRSLCAWRRYRLCAANLNARALNNIYLGLV